MDLADIIRSKKTDLKISEWKSGTISKSQFPLGKSTKKICYGTSWSWRIVTFSALEAGFRVLIKLNEEKEYYAAILALEDGNQLRVVCHHELHTAHKNWHCHFVKRDVENTFPGVLRDKDQMVCWPQYLSNDQCTFVEFPVNKQNALSFAATRFRFEECGDLL